MRCWTEHGLDHELKQQHLSSKWIQAHHLITPPCDASVMEYVKCLLRRNASEEVERAFLSSIARPCHFATCVAPPLIDQHRGFIRNCSIPESGSHRYLPAHCRQLIHKLSFAPHSILLQISSLGRKRITATAKEIEECSTSVAVKGHCIMYTADGNRFEVPLEYLGTTVFGELLRMSQEEFGITNVGRITLPCDAAVMEYVMRLLRRNVSAEVEKALLSTMVMPCHYAGCVVPTVGANQQICCL